MQFFFSQRRLLGKICAYKIQNLVIIFTEANAPLAKPKANKVILVFASPQELIRFGKGSTPFLHFQNAYVVVFCIHTMLYIRVV